MKKAKSILALLMAFLMLMSIPVAGNAALVADEAEPNNEWKKATAFGFGTDIKGALGEAADLDWYSFTADNAGLVYVTLKHDEIADSNKDLAYFEILVYDSTATRVLANFRSTGAEKESKSPTFSVDAGATYYVVVRMGTIHSETLAYSITASFDKSVLKETEPNNLSATATPLSLSTTGDNKTYYGSIAPSDVDWYKIVPTKRGAVYVYLYNGTTPADFKATLYSHDETVDGRLIEKEIASVTINSNDTSKMSVAVGVEAKEYMLKVEGIDDNIGGYKTRVFFAPATDLEIEYNNEKEFATPIGEGKALRGTTAQNGDFDFYEFRPTTEDNAGFKISLGSFDTKSTNEGSWYITVTDATTGATIGDIYKKEVKPGTASEFTTEKLVAGRIYHIKVEKGGTLNTEIYSLGTTLIEPEKKDDPVNNGNFFAQIKEYFSIFLKNFEGWFEDIQVLNIVGDIFKDLVEALPALFAWFFNIFG